MNWMDFSLEMSRESISMSQKAVRITWSMLILNVCIAIFDAACLYRDGGNIFMAACLGAMIGNILWTLIIVVAYKSSLNCERSRLKRLKEMSDDDIAKGARDQYNSAKEAYERLSEELLAKSVVVQQDACGEICTKSGVHGCN